MIDTTTEAGSRANERLRDETIIWLTTVRRDGQPQTSPVWFLWDGQTFLIYSQPHTQKVRNIAANDRVSLHLDGNGRGGDVVVVEGTAVIDRTAPSLNQVDSYLAKYRDLIAGMGATPESMGSDYDTPIRVTPAKIRTW